MSSLPLFQRQYDRNHQLESLLIALSFTSPLETKYVKIILEGFVNFERIYISNLKIRGWLRDKDDALILTDKAKRLVQLSRITVPAHNRQANKQTIHEVLVVRCLFIILLHLNFRQVREIQKQKQEKNSSYVPDLVISTQTDKLYIEVDTGSEPVGTIEAKIRGFQHLQLEGVLIYFTEERRNYIHFTHRSSSNVQFIYLLSPTLAQDILQLTSATTEASDSTMQPQPPQPQPISKAVLTPSAPPDASKFSNKIISPPRLAKYQIAHNVFVSDPELLEGRAYTLTYPEDDIAVEQEPVSDDDLKFLEGLEE